MKKVLYGTTALVAAGMMSGITPANAQWDVSVNGFMNQWFGYGDNDNLGANAGLPAAFPTLQSDANDFNQWSNSEIHFNFSNTLDNGLRFGGRVELEGNTSGDQIDESYLFVDGDFGRFLAGSENSAAYLMHIAPPNVSLAINSGSQYSHILSPFAAIGGPGSSLFRSPLGSTNIEPARANDSNKITYFTPRYSGFQFGVSYLPDTREDVTGGPGNPDTTYNNGFTAGLNYVENLGGVDVGASFGYFYIGGPDRNDVTPGSCTQTDPHHGSGRTVNVCDNFNAISAGLTLGWGGFTAGASYAEVFDGEYGSSVLNTLSGGANTNTNEGFAVEGGLAYENGPWGVSANYFYGQTVGDVFTGGYNTNWAVQGGLRYTLGPGVAVLGAIGYTEMAGESIDDQVLAGGGGADVSNKGVYVTTGIALSF